MYICCKFQLTVLKSSMSKAIYTWSLVHYQLRFHQTGVEVVTY